MGKRAFDLDLMILTGALVLCCVFASAFEACAGVPVPAAGPTYPCMQRQPEAEQFCRDDDWSATTPCPCAPLEARNL